MQSVSDEPQKAGVLVDLVSLHRMREALQIIEAFSTEPDWAHAGMKIRHEVRFINSLLSRSVKSGGTKEC